MDAPPEFEDSRPFVTIAAAFARAGVRVPAIGYADLGRGFLAMSDFGGESMLATLARKPGGADRLYRAAIDTLVSLQAATDELINVLPDYDAALLGRELDLFPQWYCERHCGLSMSAGFERTWHAARAWLIDSALAQPQVAVHRDYHSRNLMIDDASVPGVIDFQDAVIGPVGYDLVSLLKDCYIAWPVERTERWIDYYLAAAAGKGVATGLPEAFRAGFRQIGIQRHLKVLGIFCRLNYRDNKGQYLNDIPLVLSYLKAALADEPALYDLARELDAVSRNAAPLP